MKTIGFIGVGELALYTIRGVRRGGYHGRVLLSPRYRDKAALLAGSPEVDSARVEALLAAHEAKSSSLESEVTTPATVPFKTMKLELADAPDETVGQKIGQRLPREFQRLVPGPLTRGDLVLGVGRNGGLNEGGVVRFVHRHEDWHVWAPGMRERDERSVRDRAILGVWRGVRNRGSEGHASRPGPIGATDWRTGRTGAASGRVDTGELALW